MKRTMHVVLLLTGMLLVSGCQTFTLTKEEWHRQQQGQYADPEVGEVVDVFGTVGAFGAMGAMAAGAFK